MEKSLGFDSRQQQTQKRQQNCVQIIGFPNKRIQDRTDNFEQIQNSSLQYHSLLSNKQETSAFMFHMQNSPYDDTHHYGLY